MSLIFVSNTNHDVPHYGIASILFVTPSPVFGLNIFFGSLLSNMLSTVSVMACSA
jgi:hypothetical protein